MNVEKALAAIPEPDGVTLYRGMPFWEPGLAVAVGCVTGTAGPADAPAWHRDLLQVPLDAAHDLSRLGPRAYISLDRMRARDGAGVICWRIITLGLTEQEADQAFEAVCAAVMS